MVPLLLRWILSGNRSIDVHKTGLFFLVFFPFYFFVIRRGGKKSVLVVQQELNRGFLDLFDERSATPSNDASCGDSFPVTSVKNPGTACTIRRFKGKEQNRY